MKLQLQEVTPSIWHYKSEIDGPKTLISGGIHGNEKAGIHVVQQLVDRIRTGLLQPMGELLLVLGNLDAIEVNKRYVQHDMNRLWGKSGGQKNGPEQDRVNAIKQAISNHMPHIDTHFDVHNVMKSAAPFIVWPHEAWPNEREKVETLLTILDLLGIKTILYGSGFYGAGGDHITFDTYTHKVHGANSLTIEAGSSQDTHLAEKVLGAIEEVLTKGISPSNSGHTDKKFWFGNRAVINQGHLQFTAPVGNFTLLPEGVFARDGETQHIAERGEHIVFPNPDVAPGLRAGVIVSPTQIQY